MYKEKSISDNHVQEFDCFEIFSVFLKRNTNIAFILDTFSLKFQFFSNLYHILSLLFNWYW